METKPGKLVCLFLLSLLFTACDLFEMRGFVASYESVNERFDQSMEWNDEHPFKTITVADDDYNIFVMADSHTGGVLNLNAFFDEAIDINAVAAVMVGDLTNGHSADYKKFDNQVPDEDVLLTFPVVGNHDLYFDGWKQFYKHFGSSTYLFTVNTATSSDLYICLDTGSGTLGSSQLNWLKDILENERQAYRYCVVFTHNNLFRIRHTTSTNPCVEELRVLTDLSVRYNIDVIITGHDHKRNLVVMGNTTHVTLDALKDDYKYAGYFNLHIENGDLGYDFINL
ncbi:MAG: metallophosphoesterase [Bacteroidales bacterium]